MQEDNFIEWRILTGKLRGTLSEKEEREFQTWFDAGIRHQKYFKLLGKLWNVEEEVNVQVDVEAMIRDFDRHVKLRKKQKNISIRRWWIGITAVIVPLMVLGTLIFWNYGERGNEQITIGLSLIHI